MADIGAVARPNVEGIAQSRERTMGSWESNQRSIQNRINRYQADLASYDQRAKDKALEVIEREHADKPEEQQMALAKDFYKELKQQEFKRLEGEKIAISDALPTTWFYPEDVEMTQEQRQQIQAGEPWQRTETQARRELLKRTDDPEARIEAVAGSPQDIAARAASDPSAMSLEQLMGEQQIGAPSKMENAEGGGLASWIGDALGYASRGAQAFVGSLGQQAVSATKDVPVEIKQDQWDEGNLPPSALSSSSLFVREEEAAPQRTAGVPVKALAEKVIEEPGKVGTALSNAWDAAVSAANDKSKKSDVSTFLKQVEYRYQDQALDMAVKEVEEGKLSPDQAEARAKQLFSQMMDDDVGQLLIENPNATQFAVEMVLDPLNLVGSGTAKHVVSAIRANASKVPQIAKAVEVASKAVEPVAQVVKTGMETLAEAPSVKKAQDVIEGIGQITDKFRYMPQMRRFGKESPEAARAAMMARVADSEAITATRNAGRKFDDLILQMKQGAKTPEKRAELMHLLESKEDIDVVRKIVPDDLKSAFEAGKELAEESWKFSMEAGLTRWGKGEFIKGKEFLQTAGKTKGFVPHYVRQEEGIKKVYDSYGRVTLQSRSAKSRKTAGDNVLLDPVEQWEAWVSGNLTKQRTSLQLRKTDKAMREGNFVREASNRKLAGTDISEADDLVNKLNETSSIKWVKLEGEIADEYQMFTGKVGTIKGTKATIVPEHYAQLIDTFKPFVMPSQKGSEQAAQVLKGLGKMAKDFQGTWRFFTTIPNPAFSVRNFISGFGFSTIALGTKALNPAHQGKAILASMIAAAGDKSVFKKLGSKMTYTMRSGKKASLEDIIASADKLGITQQLDERLVSGMRGKGIVGRGLDYATQFGNVKGLRYLSPAYTAKMTENYQHLVAYMGALDDLSPDGVAKAFEFANKFSGNYAQMGQVERGFIREATGFYAWTRFAMPWFVTQLKENPHRLAAWVKAHGGLERYMAPNAPFSGEGMSDYLRAWGVTAPKGSQPSRHLPRDENGDPIVDSHQFAMMMMENPVTMGVAMWKPFINAFGGDFSGEKMGDLLGPLAKLGVEIISQQDMDGNPLGPFFDFSSAKGFAASGLGTVLQDTVARPSKAFSDVVRLYRQYDRPVEEIDLKLRYTVGRHLMGMDALAMKLSGGKTLSIGGMFDPETGVPGFFQYPVDPMKEATRRQRAAKETIGRRSYDISSQPDILFGAGGGEE